MATSNSSVDDMVEIISNMAQPLTEATRDELSLALAAALNSAAPKAYKSYVALLTQESTNAPVPIVLEDTFEGDVAWGYDSAGSYTATLTGEFTTNKTGIFIGANYDTGGETFYAYSNDDDNTITVEVLNAAGTTNVNGALIGTMIEIRVYA